MDQTAAETIQQEMLQWMEEVKNIRTATAELYEQAIQFDLKDVKKEFEILEI